MSDHDYVKLHVSLEKILFVERGSGVWCFNNSLLSNTVFKDVLRRVIADFRLKIPNSVLYASGGILLKLKFGNLVLVLVFVSNPCEIKIEFP